MATGEASGTSAPVLGEVKLIKLFIGNLLYPSLIPVPDQAEDT